MGNIFLNFNKADGLPHIERKFPQTYNLEKKQSIPKHPKNRSGVCFVVGTHPCVHDDIAAAAKIFPGADVCVINDAADLIVAQHLATAHPEKLDQFLEKQPEIPEIHSRSKMKRPGARENEFIWELNTGGGSGLFAVAVMLSIGYELVVMCGCPMSGGGGYAVKKHDSTLEDPRFGELSPEHSLVQGWHGQLKRFKDENPHAIKVRSMSGVTKKIFGGIEQWA